MPRQRLNLIKRLSIIFLLLVFVAGCQKTALYHGLSEEEANEMMVILYENNIEVTKEKEIVQNEVSWTVMVNTKKLAEARKILVKHNLPRKFELGLGGVYKEKGLIPTPDEQKARFLLAIKGEIINSLEKIPEVVDADVVINIPTPDEFSKNDDKRPAASVVVKIKPDDNVTAQVTESKVQQFVANAVENLNPRDVSVIISYLSPAKGVPSADRLILPETEKKPSSQAAIGGDTVSVAGISVSKQSAARLKIYLATFFLLLMVVSAVLIVMVVRTTRMKQEFKALSTGEERPLLGGRGVDSSSQEDKASE